MDPTPNGEGIPHYCDTNGSRQVPPTDCRLDIEHEESGISAKGLSELLEELKADNSVTKDCSSTPTHHHHHQQQQQQQTISNGNKKRKKEVYKFETDWPISNVCWSNDGQFKLALTSFIEEYKNFVQVVQLPRDEPDQELESILTFEHPYPATKVQWIPQRLDDAPQLLATTADYLRLWRINQRGIDRDHDHDHSHDEDRNSPSPAGAKLECLLNSNQNSKLCAPLSSFDWSHDASSIVTSSVDTTCAVWDINTATITSQIDNTSSTTTTTSPPPPPPPPTTTTFNLRTQLVAHDNHVYDVAWLHDHAMGKEAIVTSSADGSVRLFDLRDLSTSTVLYENDVDRPDRTVASRSPLVRVSCSQMESHLVATFAIDSNELVVLDIRNPGEPLCVLSKHLDSINSMSWSPKSARSICTGASDKQALIWQISDQDHKQQQQQQINEPLLAYRANGKINSTSWSPSNIWVAIGYRNCLELLRV